MRRLRHQCSLISGTIFEATKLPLTRWFLAMHLLTQAKNNVSALELKRHLGVSYRSAWLIKHKIMEAMRLREDGRELDGRVEIDDAYLGGERSGANAGAARRTRCRSWPRCRPPRTASRSGVPASATLYRGGNRGVRRHPRRFGHRRLRRAVVLSCHHPGGAGHERIVTGGGKASVKLPQFRAVNTLLGNLKTAITGPTTPSTSPSTPTATSPSSSTASTGAST